MKIIRHGTYREKLGHYYRTFKTNTVLKNDTALQKKFHDLYAEIDWMENEYRSYVSHSSGLFTWKKVPEYDTSRLYFRLESESNVRKLQECAKTLEQWEESFNNALGNLERDMFAMV